ncbi:E3 ubiquitin-protein ligase (plasmid) [Sinorhizobium americanum CCGM7]|nr:E3 ubiquitin-protein ligase [Sinorhizobium americanum CCGM7]
MVGHQRSDTFLGSTGVAPMMKTKPAQPCDGDTRKANSRRCFSPEDNLTTGAINNSKGARASSEALAGCPNLAPHVRATSLDYNLDAWAAQKGQGENEDRHEAVKRISAWVVAGDLSAVLDLSFLRLSTLPAELPAGLHRLNVDCNHLAHLPGELPAELQALNARYNRLSSLPGTLPRELQILEVSYNRLISLPDVLPATLQWLGAGGNRLASLPDNLPIALETINVDRNKLTYVPAGLPAGLQTLNVDGNRLTSLPDNLPSGLQTLNANGNELTNLPHKLPAGLQTLGAADNRLAGLPNDLPSGLRRLNARCNLLISLPDKLLAQLSSGCLVFLESNPLPKWVRANVAATVHAADYGGPLVCL